MVKLLSHGTFVVSIPESVIQQVLNIYPDENLHERKVFLEAVNSGVISYKDLLKECDVLHLPWQLFMLSEEKLASEMHKIDELRKSKFNFSKIASRAGSTHRISMRLLDRIIAFQQFNQEYCTTPNPFVSALTTVDRDNWIPYIIKYFEIDIERFNSVTKEKALDYLIACLETKNICVSRGVLSNKILPVSNDLRDSYKQSSGFVVQDQCLPYIFLPNEVNREETAGRQIYTLTSLLMLVGLGEYNILVNSDFAARVKGSRLTKKIHGAVAEMLLPYEATNLYKDTVVDAATRDSLSATYNVTPTAVVITLRERDIITADECEDLLNSISAKPVAATQYFNSPKLTTSIEKFCGKLTNTNIIIGLSDNSLTSTRAQYLLFGHVDKIRLHRFKAMNNL